MSEPLDTTIYFKTSSHVSLSDISFPMVLSSIPAEMYHFRPSSTGVCGRAQVHEAAKLWIVAPFYINTQL